MPTFSYPAIADEIGYKMHSAFWNDFTIADAFGKKSIQDTFDRAFKEWKDDKVMGTELTMVLNWKSWEHSNNGIATDIGSLYAELYYKIDNYILDNWKGEKLSYFLQTTD